MCLEGLTILDGGPRRDLCKTKKKLSHVSLFSGAGGLDLGLDNAGFTMVAAVERDQHARATLQANCGRFRFPDFTLFEDVNTLTGEDLLVAAGVRRGGLDLLSGGPPCQPFSTAGHRLSIIDPRGSLFGRYLQLAEELQPRFFVIENVRGVLSAALKHRPLDQRGNGHKPLAPNERLGSLLSEAILPGIRNRLGYQVTYGLVNAADYGVPQIRQRVIFIGSRDHELAEAGRTPGINELVRPTHAKTPTPGQSVWRTLGDALEGLVETELEVLRYSPARAAILAQVPPGKNWRHIRDSCADDYLRQVMGGAYSSSGGRVGFWRRLRFEAPSPTLPASPIQKATSLCHPVETRPLSVREYARVQQFPDEYVFSGPTSAKYTQIGNAVPVGLAEAVGAAVARLSNGETCPEVPTVPIQRHALERAERS